MERTKPTGRIIGIDIIPAQPPKGVSTIQGNFLSQSVQAEVKRFLADPERGRMKQQFTAPAPSDRQQVSAIGTNTVIQDGQSYVELERNAEEGDEQNEARMVDVVLSDMSAPFEQTAGFWKRSLSDPYLRMMNTSGITFKDHAGSMVRSILVHFWLESCINVPKQKDLCVAALQFAKETLKTGGSFICKFYQGAEDKAFEMQLKALFKVVHREKPESSRSVSIEILHNKYLLIEPGIERGIFCGTS